MRVVIAGGHGQIALHLQRLLTARGDSAVGLVRNPEHEADLRDIGGQPVVLDLEHTDERAVAEVLEGADAAVFAAGAGPGSGIARKDTVDRAAADLFAAAAERAGVRRHLLVSAMNVDREPPPETSDVFAAYLQAKAASELALRTMGLDWTVLRPGRLTNDKPTGTVSLGEDLERGEVTRADVAAVLLALLDEPRTAGRTLAVVGGPAPVAEAVANSLID